MKPEDSPIVCRLWVASLGPPPLPTDPERSSLTAGILVKVVEALGNDLQDGSEQTACCQTVHHPAPANRCRALHLRSPSTLRFNLHGLQRG